MSDPTSEFLKDFQTRAQTSMEEWMRQLHRASVTPAEFSKHASTPGSAEDLVARSLAGLKGYADWMQGAAASVSAPQGDWRQQVQQLFGGASQPFSQGFAGADDASAKAFVEQWQAWLQAFQKGDVPGRQESGPAAGFGFGQEPQAQQQALAEAIARHLEASQRYQALMQRSNAQALEKMQARLAKLAQPGQQIESLKALYDLWVDCAEEAYAEIALSDEFREAYGEMVNTQIRVRQLQQEQTEYLCQQLGIPTRSDISSLGERLQSLRRELRSGRMAAPASHAEEIAELCREVAALKQQLSAGKAPTSAVKKKTAKKTAARTARSAVKKSAGENPPAKPGKPAARKAATVSASRAGLVKRASERKRK